MVTTRGAVAVPANVPPNCARKNSIKFGREISGRDNPVGALRGALRGALVGALVGALPGALVGAVMGLAEKPQGTVRAGVWPSFFGHCAWLWSS